MSAQYTAQLPLHVQNLLAIHSLTVLPRPHFKDQWHIVREQGSKKRRLVNVYDDDWITAIAAALDWLKDHPT